VANFVIVVDPDAERRTRFLNQVESLLPLLEGLVTGACSGGDFGAVWAAGPRAPISQAADDEGAAVIWGEAFNGHGSERQDAATLRGLWSDPDRRSSAFFDGFYAAVVYEPTRGLAVGADLLGLYPVYYYCSGDVALVGSSPELFRYHPSFRQEFNPAGLVGILLTGGLFEGQTLFRDVHRLSPGHLLSWRPGTPPAEIQQYTMPFSDRYFSFPLAAMVDPLHRALDQAFARQVPRDERVTLLLSGGMDSRMLAGYLSERGHEAVALTCGSPTDLETKAARAVAKTLGFEHHVMEFPLDQYPYYADLTVLWEHLAAGFSFPWGWGLPSCLRDLAPYTVSGHVLDYSIGGAFIPRAYSPSSMTMSFEPYFAFAYVFGLRPQTLNRLLRREVFGDLVDETMARIQQVYESYGELESQRIMGFDLYHRGRFHVGQEAWKISFGAWPVLPGLDRSVLETAAGMPGAALAKRPAQALLLCQRFPELAQLPMDTCYDESRALQPRLRHRVAWHIEDRLAPHVRRLQRLLGVRPAVDDRVHRVTDFHGLGWQAIRRHAEPHRDRVSQLLDREVLDELLPPPEGTVDSWRDSLPLKLIVGLLLFSKEHL
jgi:asparagine synthase (glutamine-hydrolysing)